jgi:molybdopterin-guanine dinucleotide biosynthesis protein A
MADTAGAVLAGGAGRRFGSDKTRALLGGRSLLERVAAVLAEAGLDPVAAIGGRPGAGVAVVPDRHPGQGPLGAVVTALAWSPRPRTVVAAGDLALLDPLTVRALADRGRRQPAAVAVARAGGRLQPTLACWPGHLLPSLQAAFAGGQRSVAGVLAGITVEPVDVPDRVVVDVDTRDDLDRLRRGLAG